MRSPGRSQRGMALILALVVVLIVMTLVSGMLLLSVSHFALSHTNSAYANALNLAEAGINYELWKISHNASQLDLTPVTVEVPPGSGRTFTVHVELTDPLPAPFSVVSTGLVDGTQRTVRLVASGNGPSGLYALFGIDSLNVGGNATIIGALGTNGVVNTNGTPTLDGNFWYCGGASGSDVTPLVTGEVFHSTLSEWFPTINQLANERAFEKFGATTTLGVDFFANSAYNSNANIRDTTGKVIALNQYKLDHNAFSKAANDSNPYLADGVTPNPLYNKNVIVLGPGDYYLEGMDVVGQNGIKIDTSAGVVNIWIGKAGEGTSAQTDTIDGGSMFFTGHDSTHFHLYEGSRRSLRMNGTMDFYGNIYAYNGPDASGLYYGSIKLLGDGNISGSVIGYDVQKTTGSCTINFPSSGGFGEGGPGGVIPGEPVLFYGFDHGWQEMNPL